MISFGKSDKGLVREKNEDTIYFSDEKVGSLPNLYIVADGMGGHRGGEVASSMAVSSFCSYFANATFSFDAANDETIENELKKGVYYANNLIYDKSIQSPDLAGMGTTFLGMTLIGSKLYIANVGDCRLYSASNNLTQVTQDHSYVMELVKQGQITEEQARNHPQKNILTRALGVDKDLNVDTHCVIKPDDAAILCSDGLSNMLSDEQICRIVSMGHLTEEERVQLLIDSANKEGGKDNISVILISMN